MLQLNGNWSVVLYMDEPWLNDYGCVVRFRVLLVALANVFNHVKTVGFRI